MKKIQFVILLSFIVMAAVASAKEKKNMVEVLYFKANLACCKARACDALEGKVKEIIQKNWADSSVTFRQVKLTDSTNVALVKKYNAQSQTLVLLKTGKKKEMTMDVSALLQEYAKTNDAQKFENEFIAKINEFIRQK